MAVENKHQSGEVRPPANQRADEEFKAAECYAIIPGRLYFTAHWSREQTQLAINNFKRRYYFSTFYHDSYKPLCAEFGPVDLSSVYWFCQLLDEKMTDPRLEKRPIIYYCSMDTEKLSNMSFLLGCYMVLMHHWTPEQAWKPFQVFNQVSTPFRPFRDPSYSAAKAQLSILDCLRGIKKAHDHGWFDLESFDIDAYEKLDETRNGDCHLIANKFLAMRGPTDEHDNAYTFTPGHYVPIFQEHHVEAVVRLNDPEYDAEEFTDAGLTHHELQFPDGTVPSPALLTKFLKICDQHGKIAIHCSAGLGRTGTLIAFWLIYHFRFTAAEAIAYVRISRPGSVVAAQQQWLERVHHCTKPMSEKACQDMSNPDGLMLAAFDNGDNFDDELSEELAFQIGSSVMNRGKNTSTLTTKIKRAASFGLRRPDNSRKPAEVNKPPRSQS